MDIRCNAIINHIESNQCVGCGACVSVCPVDALSFTKDKWGYYVADIDFERCVGCGKCVVVCPICSHKASDNHELVKAYCFISGNKDVLQQSSSGGAFYHLSKKIFENNGIVFGAEWTDDFSVRHNFIEDIRDLPRLQKSKYLQSYMGNIFRDVKNALDDKKEVLFSGCPCQIAGLKSFLGRDYDNLYLVDLL